MFRKGFLLFLLTFFTAFLQAQTFEWANNLGGGSQDISNAIVSDEKGNNYFAGRFNDTVIFASDTLIAQPFNSPVILGKHTSKGKEVWAVQTSHTFGVANDIAFDDSGYIYITGFFNDTMVFSNKDTLKASSKLDLFVAKYDTAGSFQWAFRKGSGVNDDEGIGISLKDSFLYVCGYKGDSAYLAKFDKKGNTKWEVTSNGNGNGEFKDLGNDGNGKVFCTGDFENKIKFGNDSVISTGGTDILLAQFDSSGNLKNLSSEGGKGRDVANSIALTQNSNFFLTGEFDNSATFGSKNIQGRSQFSNAFIAYYDKKLQLKWVNQASNKNIFPSGNDVVSFQNEFAYIIGRYSNVSGNKKPLIFLKDTIESSGGSDIFILKVNDKGRGLFAFGTGSQNNDEGEGIAIDKNGNAYFTGSFQLSTKFGKNNLTSNGARDIYVTKLSDIRIYQDTLPDTTLCAGQSLQVPFTVDGDFDPGNTFTAQLSNDTGNFDNPINIGSIKDTMGDTIQAFIPDTLPYGTGYEMRIVSDSPRVVSFDDGQTYTIYPYLTPQIKSATVSETDTATGQAIINWHPWPDSSGVVYGRLYGKGPSDTAFQVLKDSIAPQDSAFVHDSLNTKNNTYQYYLTTVDSCGFESDSSNIHKTMNLTFTGGQLSHNLKWTPYQGWLVQNYLVQRKQGNAYQTLDSLPGGDTSIIKFPEPCNFAINYRIKAIDPNGHFSYSDTAANEAIDTIKPNGAQLRNVSVAKDSIVQINFTGADSLDIFAYDVMRQKASGNARLAKRVVFNSPGGTFAVYDTTSAQNESLCYHILTKDSCLNVVTSDTFCTTQLKGQPKNQANLLSWEKFKGYPVDSQLVLRYDAGSYNTIARLSGKDTSFVDTPLPCNKPKTYKLKSFEQGGSRNTLSDSITLTPFDTIPPVPPELRSLSILSKDSAHLAWYLSDSNVTQYEVWVKSSFGNSAVGSWQVVDTVGVDSSYKFGNLNTSDSIYCARIVAIDSCAANRSGFSQKHCAVQLEGTPGNQETSLNWHSYEGFSNPTYHIQRKTTNTSWQTLGSRTDTTFNDTLNLACNVTYTYRVRTVSPSGNDTSYSDTLNLQPYDTTAPPVPQLRFASANLQDEVEVEWEWDTTSDQKYFELWRDQGNGNYTIQDTITYDSTYLDASATPGQTTHAYFVRAIDSSAADGTIGAPGNRSIPSDTDRIMVPEVETGACLPESRLSRTPYESLPQGTDHYKIYRQQPATNNAFQQIGTSPDTSFTDTAILDGNEYCYRIEAVDTQSGYTAYSDSICMQPFVYPSPDTSEVLRATVEKTDNNNGEILVEWRRAPESDTFARGYYIYHRQNGGNYTLIQNQTDLDDTTYRHRGINTSKFPHEYRVVIYNLCLENGGYREVHRPVKMYGENRNLEVALDWLPYQGFDVQRYEVQRSVNGSPFSAFDSLSGMDTAYRDSTGRCGNRYTYRIYAEGDEDHEQSLSDTISFIAYDTIPPDRAQINVGSVVETSETNGITELEFEPASQGNRKGYIVYRSEDNSRFVPVDTLLTNATNTITYSDSILSTQYSILSYYVRSIDSCNNIAAPSDTHQLIHLQAEARSLANQIDWTAYKDWENWYYELQRRTPNTSWQTIANPDTGTLSYTDSTKNCDTLYYYRVRGLNTGTGEVTYSNYDTARSIDREAPEPPEPERVTVEENGNVLVEWNASVSNDAEVAHLFKKPASSNNFEPQTTNLQTTNYTDSQSNADQEPISYRLRSEDSCDNVSEPSAVHTTIYLQATPGEEQNELNWTAYEGWEVTGYEVYKDGEMLTTVAGDRLNYIDDRAVCTTYHDYRIRAIKANAEDVVSWSNTDSAQARDNTPPQAVNLTTATVVEPNEVVEVRWEASTAYDADGYELYRSGLNGTGFTPIATIEDAETTRFRDTLNQPTNQQFCYQIRVRDFCGNLTQRSNKGCVMGIEGEANQGTNTITWDEYYEWPGDIAYYNIYKKEDSNFYEQIGRTSETSYRDENLANRVTDFCYQVEAHHSEGDETSRSFEICLRQPQIVHIPNSFTPGITEGQNDKFGPEGLYIKNFEMTIFNRWGEKVFSTESGEPWDGTYEGKLAPAGIYLYSIKVTGGNGRRDSYKGSVNVVR